MALSVTDNTPTQSVGAINIVQRLCSVAAGQGRLHSLFKLVDAA